MTDQRSPFDDLPEGELPADAGASPLVDPFVEDDVRAASFAAEPFAEPRTSQRPLGGDDSDGGQALISPEESEAIIAAMRAGSLRPEPAPPIAAASRGAAFAARELPHREAKRTDLGAPEAPLRRALDRAERAARDLADVVLDQLLAMVSVLATASLLESEVVSVDAALEPYVATGTAWDVVSGDSAPRATIILGGALAEAVLARRLGAADSVAKPGARARHPSPLGRRVLEPFAQGCLDTVVRAMSGGGGALTMVPAGSTRAKLAGFAPCLKLGTRVRFGELEDDVVVVFYEEALVVRSRPTPGAENRMRDVLRDVDVEIVASLGRAHLSVRDFMALAVGSVVRLDGSPERPVALSVDGTPVLTGMPMIHEGNLAIELVERDVRVGPTAPDAETKVRAAEVRGPREERESPVKDAGKNRVLMEVRT